MHGRVEEFINDAKKSGKDWLKSQTIMSLITFVLLIIGLIIVDHFIVNFASIPVIILISFGIALADFIPVIGVSTCMLPWAVIAALLGNTKLGISVFVVFVVIMLIKQVIEPLIRGKSLGISPIEEIISSVVGYVVLGTSPIGFVIGPVVYIIGKKTYVKLKSNGMFADKNSGSYFNSSDNSNNSNYGTSSTSGSSNVKNANNDDVIDISDDVVDVEEGENK